MLGTLIIGLTSTACTLKKKQDIALCYTMTVQPKMEDSTINQNIKKQVREDSVVSETRVVASVIKELINEPPIYTIMCYDTIAIDTMPIIEPEFYTDPEIAPIPPQGSSSELLAWINKNIQYPENMIVNKIQGRVITHVMIDTLGKVTDISIVRGLTPEADKEAIRILSLSDSWTPGEHSGKKVKVQCTISVTFRLPEE